MDGAVVTEGRAVDRREGGEVEISSKWQEYKAVGKMGEKTEGNLQKMEGKRRSPTDLGAPLVVSRPPYNPSGTRRAGFGLGTPGGKRPNPAKKGLFGRRLENFGNAGD